MMNKNRWIDNYKSLNPDSQLEVAKAIENELRDNEMTFDESEYDKEKSRIVRNFFNSIKYNAKQSKELKKFADIYERYESLSQNYKIKVINEVFKIVMKYLGIQEQEIKKEVCRQEGHIFGKWKHERWTEYVDTVIDHEHVHDFPVERENWNRTCSRCGFVHTVAYEPQELIDERNEKNKQERIKKLEMELKKLKNE